MSTIANSQTQNFGAISFLSRVQALSNQVKAKVKDSNFLKKLPSPKLFILGIAAIIIVLAAFLWIRSGNNDTSVLDQSYSASGSRLELGKRFEVPIRNNKGEGTGSNLVVNVTTLERTEKILYKGKPLIARKGKDFVVINLEIENSTNNRLTVRPVDFFRLVDANGKSYAPDIQTDSVRVEPVSSKKTRTIFIVNDDPRHLKFVIGEIKGDNKEIVEVTI